LAHVRPWGLSEPVFGAAESERRDTAATPQSGATLMNMPPARCDRCSTDIPAGAAYCPGCGAPIQKPVTGETAHLDLEKFFGYALDMCCIAGVDGYFKLVNPAFEETLGYSGAELLERPFVDFIHPDDRPETHAEIGKLASGTPTLRFENRYRCKDGTYRDLAWTSFPESGTGLLYAIARDVTELRRRENRIDSLTGLATRRVFDERLVDEWKRAHRAGVSVALGLIDIDHFKAYNATYGHQVGDDRLRHLAAIIAEHCRRVGDLAARYDGQEFALLMDGGLDSEQAASMCERIRRTVADLEIPHSDAARHGVFTVSAGAAAMVPIPGLKPDLLVSEAEAALQRAKQQGRNRVVRATG
jgi:diguanylate cyclase (GGDEF)-like protein/PAS domain S-box-containing protein